jgi:hypothetical protein
LGPPETAGIWRSLARDWRTQASPPVKNAGVIEGLFALGGVALGWLCGAATQIWRDRGQARIALTLVHNELLGNIAQIDLAQRMGIDEHGTIQLSHWYRRWRLSRRAWDQHGPIVLGKLDDRAAFAVQGAYHALDAAELLNDASREAVIAVRDVKLSDPPTPTLQAVSKPQTQRAARG